LGSEVKKIDEGGGDWVHIDVMDGHFVPNLTIGPPIIKALRKNTDKPFDVHLMITDPDKYIEKFISAGANNIVVHPESSIHLHRTLNIIKDNNVKAGVALNPSTPITNIEPILSDLDLIVIMTVNPGFPAQKFIPSIIPKIELTKKLINEQVLNIEIEVDGGINVNNASLAARAGADVLVAGNAVFNGPAPTVAENIKMLKDAVNDY